MSASPTDAGPNEGIEFKVVAKKSLGNGESTDLFAFTPQFYPDRFTQKNEKELERSGQQCKGEDVSIKKMKNTEYHATGVLREENIRTVQDLLTHDDVVDVMTPISPENGLECIIKNGDVGEIHGWDPVTKQWLFNYTLDFVSTGKDDFNNVREDDIVSSKIA